MLELYFLLHLGQATRVDEQRITAKLYPWIALYPGSLAKLMTAASRLIVPATGVVLLLSGWRSLQPSFLRAVVIVASLYPQL